MDIGNLRERLARSVERSRIRSLIETEAEKKERLEKEEADNFIREIRLARGLQALKEREPYKSWLIK